VSINKGNMKSKKLKDIADRAEKLAKQFRKHLKALTEIEDALAELTREAEELENNNKP